MSYGIVNSMCTSLIALYSIDSYSKLEKFKMISEDIEHCISYNPGNIWGKFVTQENLNTAAEIGSMNFLYHNHSMILKPFHALCISLKNGHVEFFKELWKLSKIDDKIILFIACRYGNLEIVNEILEKDAIDIDICFDPVTNGPCGDNHKFEQKLDYMDVRKYLDLEDARDDEVFIAEDDDKFANEVFFLYGTRPLHIACLSGNIALIEYLIEKGAKIDSCAGYDCERVNASTISLYAGHYHVFNYLYQKRIEYDYFGEFHKIGGLEPSYQAIIYRELIYSIFWYKWTPRYSPDVRLEKDYHNFDAYNESDFLFETRIPELNGVPITYNNFKEIYDSNRSHAIELFDVIQNDFMIFVYGDPHIIEHYNLEEKYAEWSQKFNP